ncbi:expressed unknown protein [Seminavis robusta]|uniref:Uncharacterized protein n=1 Tax=Seminavis robusta TaxID=568900 RepID=A0A9N8DX90_9STRA|nr:expressed unknown protein [Seminavis robusta]|eukprot:Sro350_g123710.1 n/a (2635) ;mRNA; r:27612-35897
MAPSSSSSSSQADDEHWQGSDYPVDNDNDAMVSREQAQLEEQDFLRRIAASLEEDEGEEESRVDPDEIAFLRGIEESLGLHQAPSANEFLSEYPIDPDVAIMPEQVGIKKNPPIEILEDKKREAIGVASLPEDGATTASASTTAPLHNHQNISAKMSVAPPVKRPRGRPRKNPLPLATTDNHSIASSTPSSVATSTNDPPKKKRGRPRKSPLPEEKPPQEEPKRKRGRPRKIPASEEKEAPPKKRGRPRKTPVEVSQSPPQDETTVPAAASATTITTATDPPKKKRGRPRKHPLPQQQPQATAASIAAASQSLQRSSKIQYLATPQDTICFPNMVDPSHWNAHDIQRQLRRITTVPWDARSRTRATHSLVQELSSTSQSLEDSFNWDSVAAAVHQRSIQWTVRRSYKDNKDVKMIVVRQSWPKQLCTVEMFDRDCWQPFCKQAQSSVKFSTRQIIEEGMYDLSRVYESHQDFVRVTIQGRSDVVEEFRQFADETIRTHWMQTVVMELLKDPHHLELEMKLSIAALLAHWGQNIVLVEVLPSKKNTASGRRVPCLGLWIDSNQLLSTTNSEEGRDDGLLVGLQALFGGSREVLESPQFLAVITRVDYQDFSTHKQWQKQREILQFTKDTDVTVTLALCPSLGGKIALDRTVGGVRQGSPQQQQQSQLQQLQQHYEESEKKSATEQQQNERKEESEEQAAEKHQHVCDNKAENQTKQQPEKQHQERLKGPDNEVMEQKNGEPPVGTVNIADAADVTTVVSGLSVSSAGSRSSSGEGGSAAQQQPQEQQQKEKRDDAYQKFKTKCAVVYDTEYAHSEIGYQSVISRMWIRHKAMFSEDCHEDCPCLLRLDELTTTIVPQYHKKKGELPRGLKDEKDSPVGFVNHFFPKFKPLVVKEFPKENPGQTLARLVKMWESHIRQRAFGSRCVESCCCIEGWKRVFRCGDVFTKAPPKKEKPKQFSDFKLPRKRPREPLANHNKAGDVNERTTKQRLVPNLPQQPKNPTNEKPKAARAPAAGNGSNLRSYSVAFDAIDSLGFLCVTGEVQGRKMCVIASVAPSGQAAQLSKLIQKGSCVESVEVSQNGRAMKYVIEGHADLKQYYDLERSRRSELKVWFTNLNVQLQIPGVTGGSDDWANGGKWKVSSVEGWAGGASIAKPPPPTLGQEKGPPPNGRNGGQTANYYPHVARRPGTETAQPKQDGNSVNLCAARGPSSDTAAAAIPKLAEPRKPNHRNGSKPLSIFRAPADKGIRTQSQKVQFKTEAHFEERFYQLGSDPTEIHLVCPDVVAFPVVRSQVHSQEGVAHGSTQGDNDPPATEASVLKSLVQALRNNKIEGLLAALETGLVRTDSITSSGARWLDSEYQYAKERNLPLVKTVIRTYRTADLTITAAKCLKSWCRYEVRVEKIVGVKLTEIGELHPEAQRFEGVVSHYVHGNQQRLQGLPPRDIPITGEVEYPGMPEDLYLVNFNRGISEGRTLVIELRSSGGGKKFCSLSLPIRDISDRCYVYHKEVVLERPFSDSSVFRRGMKLRLVVRKVPLEPNFISERRRRACADLSTVVEWVDRFQNENAWKHRLSANILGPNNFSLLHSAVVFQEPRLVKKLLARGADPTARSDTVGSAVAFAMSIKHHIEESKLEAERQKSEVEQDSDEEEKSMSSDGQVATQMVLEQEERALSPEELVAKQIAQELQARARHLESLNNPSGSSLDTSTTQPGGAPEEPQKKEVAQNDDSVQPMCQDEKNGAHSTTSSSGETSESKENAPPMAKALPVASSQEDHHVVLFCKAVLNGRVRANADWVAESMVALAFYKCANTKAKESFANARSNTFNQSLVEFGRRNLKGDGRMVKCGLEKPPKDLSNERFVRLQQAGLMLALHGGRKKPNTISTSVVEISTREATQQPQAGLKDEKRSNSTESRLQPQQTALPQPTSVATDNRQQFPSASNPSPKSAGSPAHGASKDMLDTTSGETTPKKRPSLEGVDSALQVFLESTWSTEGTWEAQGELALRFYRNLGKRDKKSLLIARKKATELKLIEWGRRNLRELGEPVVPTYLSKEAAKKQGLSLDTYLRLSALGLEFIEGNGFLASEEQQWRQGGALNPSGEQSPESIGSFTSLDSRQPPAVLQQPMSVAQQSCPAFDTSSGPTLKLDSSTNNVTDNGKTPPKKRPSLQGADGALQMFLESTWSGDTGGAWVAQTTLVERFSRRNGGKDTKAMFLGKKQATAKKLVEWGRRNLRAAGQPIVPCSYLKPDEAQRKGLSLETYIRLCPSGRRFIEANGFPGSEEAQELQHSVNNSSPNLGSGGPERRGSQSKGVQVLVPSEEDMKLFLQCISKGCQKGLRANLESAVSTFLRAVEDREDSGALLLGVLKTSATKDLVDWGPERNMIMSEPNRYRTLPPGYCIRLTSEGLTMQNRSSSADGSSNDETVQQHGSRRNSFDATSPGGDNHRPERRGSITEAHPRFTPPNELYASTLDRNSAAAQASATLPTLKSLDEPSGGRGFGTTANDSGVDHTLPNTENGRFWFVTGRNFCEQQDGCTCPKQHLFVPPATAKPGSSIPSIPSAEISWQEVANYGGALNEATSMFTAAYYNKDRKLYFVSCGGASGRKNSQCVYWYPSKALAKRALESAIAVAEATLPPVIIKVD